MRVGSPWPGVVAWSLLLPYLALHRWSILRRSARAHIVSMVTGSIALGFWLQVVSWSTVPDLPALTAVLLVGLNTAFQFTDAQVTYDLRWVWPLQLIPPVVFDLALLLFDAFGGEGLLSVWEAEPGAGPTWLILQSLGFFLSVAILTVVGRFARERDERLVEFAQARSQLDVLKAEQAVVQRTCDLMLGGLQAGRFSHDVAGPLSVMGVTLKELDRACPAEARASLGPIIVDLRVATERLREMTAFMSRGLKGEHPAAPRDIHELLEESKKHLRHLLKGHGRDVPELWVDVQPAEVMAEPLHATAIANILANGALQGGDAPLVVLGERGEDGAYELVLRDHGVAPAQRAEAMERVKRATSLSFRPTQDSRDESYEGQGLGLFLACIVLSRQGGSIEVREPQEGPGLELCIHLRLAQGTMASAGEPPPA